jgi:hypothetical protein
MYVKLLSEPLTKLDFWWVKPKAAEPTALELQTLHRHAKGTHKNDPGRSRALYVQFADLFVGGEGDAAGDARAVGGGMLRFGVTDIDGAPRAFVELITSGERMYLYLIWQARPPTPQGLYGGRRGGKRVG